MAFCGSAAPSTYLPWEQRSSQGFWCLPEALGETSPGLDQLLRSQTQRAEGETRPLLQPLGICVLPVLSAGLRHLWVGGHFCHQVFPCSARLLAGDSPLGPPWHHAIGHPTARHSSASFKLDCPSKCVCLGLLPDCFYVCMPIQFLFPTKNFLFYYHTNKCSFDSKLMTHIKKGGDQCCGRHLDFFNHRSMGGDPKSYLWRGIQPNEHQGRGCTASLSCCWAGAAPHGHLPWEITKAAQKGSPSKEHTFSTARRKPRWRRPQSSCPLACPTPWGAPFSSSAITFSLASGDNWRGLFRCPAWLAVEGGQMIRGRGDSPPLPSGYPGQGGASLTAAA